MKLILVLLIVPLLSRAQDLSPEEQRQLLKEVQSLKERVNTLENKESGQGFKSTDYKDKTTAADSAPTAPKGPAMTEEQRKEVMEAMEKYKKAREEHDKALKELEDEE